jgi:acyl-CoA synthetase (AMP-forming)/AMP-acid ligase II
MALNIADLFEHAADAFGDRTAVACGDRQVSYRELDERTNRLAHHLAGLGVGAGDHVGLYARNSIEAIETLIASYKLRARAVNINYRYVRSELHFCSPTPITRPGVRQVLTRRWSPCSADTVLADTVLADSGVRGTA